MAVKTVLNKVLKSVVPSARARRELESVLSSVQKKVESQMLKSGITMEFFVGGSVAKDTWLSNAKDIDIFLRVPKEYENISESAFTVLQKCFKKNLKTIHGSRDYYSADFKGYHFEFVPVLLVDKITEIQNMTDASPFHVQYIKEHLTKEQCNEVRLLKAFCKSAGIYGAESFLSGFSGYSLELLTSHYSSFLDILYDVESWKPKLFIDVENYYSSLNKALSALGDSKTGSPLILVDPVMKSRNASAALSIENFSKFILASRLFLNNPKPSYFKPCEKLFDDIKKISSSRGTKLFSFKMKIPEDINKDVFLAKNAKKAKKMVSFFESHGYSVYEHNFLIENNEVTFWFEFEVLSQSSSVRHYGPAPWVDEENFSSFVSKWKKSRVYVEDSYLVVDKQREFKTLKEIFQYAKKNIL